MDNNNNNNSISVSLLYRIRVYLIVIIIAYFLVKLIFGLFKVYPRKYYNQTITINTNKYINDDETEQIINAYVPGMWNSELTDFLIMVVMSLILFFIKFNNTFPLTTGNSAFNYTLWLPFIVTLVLPGIFTATTTDVDKYNSVISIVVFSMAIFMIFFNLFSGSAGGSWVYYIVFSILIAGLGIMMYVIKSNSSVYTTVLYNVREKGTDKCTDFSMENIVVKSSGDKLKLNIAFMTWLAMLFIPYNNGIVSNVFNGLLLGLFVGYVSFVGMQYPLIKTASDFCKTKEECAQKGIPYSDVSGASVSSDVINKLKTQTDSMQSRINVNSWTVIAICLTVSLVLMYLAMKGTTSGNNNSN